MGGTLAAARAAGIRVLATGGLGGVHRGWAERLDVSADLGELARTPIAVVASGAKSLLDVEATAELLESLGVPVLGLGTDTLPLFYAAAGGPPVSARVEGAVEAATVVRAHWALGRPGGVLVAQPPPVDLDVLDLVEEEVAAAANDGVRGPAVTPRVLARLHERTEGRSLEANRALVAANARLGGELAVALATPD